MNQAGNFDRNQLVSFLTYLGFLTFSPNHGSDNSHISLEYRLPNEIFFQAFLDYLALKGMTSPFLSTSIYWRWLRKGTSKD